MKKVIFVGGSSYSGSTLLDLMLANAPDGFSCGEVSQMFHPYKQHHFNLNCGCGKSDCTLWGNVQKAGINELYATIFKTFSNVNTIVDSSKDPLWIYERSQQLRAAGIDVKNILIWKTPEEYYYSCAKRGKELRWENAWINYHSLYFRMVPGWQSVRCADLVASDDTLESVSDAVGIEYFSGKRRYWDKVHHTLFGNHSAKLHLYEKGTDAYERSMGVQIGSFRKLADSANSQVSHQTIVTDRAKLDETVKYTPSKRDITDRMVAMIESRDAAGGGSTPNSARPDGSGVIDDLKASRAQELKRRTRRALGTRVIKLYMGLRKQRTA
ncbi:MAG: hypothetical protein H0V62_08800 [Gammaproteobacteria bacterium]|nr:hypothetical protein [Gammaproteobacteria bacterium]